MKTSLPLLSVTLTTLSLSFLQNIKPSCSNIFIVPKETLFFFPVLNSKMPSSFAIYLVSSNLFLFKNLNILFAKFFVNLKKIRSKPT